eukprot:9028615-Alexandrium_andersonii.AAC.1
MRTLTPFALFIRWLHGVPDDSPRPGLGRDAIPIRRPVSVPKVPGVAPMRGHTVALIRFRPPWAISDDSSAKGMATSSRMSRLKKLAS